MGHGPNPMNAARMQSFTNNKAPVVATSHIADPSCYIDQINLLPVTLIEFKGKQLPTGSVELTWITAQEINCKQFQIQHSTNSLVWSTIGTVNGSGNSSIQKNYTFAHDNPTVGNNYYQLVQVDFNGSKRRFGPVVINVRDKAGFTTKAYPNPAVFDFNVVVTAEKSQKATIQFFDIQGHLLRQEKINIVAGFNKFNYPVGVFGNYKGELIIHINTEFNIQKTLRQILKSK
jgi:hypothetical protein